MGTGEINPRRGVIRRRQAIKRRTMEIAIAIIDKSSYQTPDHGADPTYLSRPNRGDDREWPITAPGGLSFGSEDPYVP
jgi:hypothetical protein